MKNVDAKPEDLFIETFRGLALFSAVFYAGGAFRRSAGIIFLEEIHEKQQLLDRLDYMIHQMKNGRG